MSTPAFAGDSVHILSRQGGCSQEVFPPPHSGEQAGLLQPRGHRECQEGDHCRGPGWLRGVFLPPLPCHGEGPAEGQVSVGGSVSPCPWLRYPCPGAQGSVGTGVQILAVSHTGIKLLRMVKGTNVSGEQLRVLRAYR